MTRPVPEGEALEIAAKLSAMQAIAVDSFNGWSGWLSAEVADLPGATLNALVQKGCLERRRDPYVLGRSEYRVLPLGLAVRNILQGEQE